MWTNNQHRVPGHDDRQILNRHFTHDPKSDELTVIIAGFGYTIESPFLFYSKHVPFGHGSDVLTVDLQYSLNRKFLAASQEERDGWFREDSEAIARTVAGLAYQRLSFIGKSLGTTIVYGMLQQPTFLERTRRVVWLTPGQLHAEIEELMLTSSLPSLAVYGERDRLAQNTEFEALRSRHNVELMIVPDADHALETDDVFGSVSQLGEYVRRLDAFWSSITSD